MKHNIQSSKTSFRILNRILNGVMILLSFLSISSATASSEIKEAKRLQLLSQCPLANGFDYPVGKPNASGYYNAQKFGKNYHLGDDWNGTGGGNTDLGDPVYAIADGIVAFSEDLKGGWGNVVRVYHNKGTKQKPIYIESIYAHLNKRLVTENKLIKKGDKIGTIGNANGKYLAHLHLEVRDNIDLPIGPGYSKNTIGYLDPTRFIQNNRR